MSDHPQETETPSHTDPIAVVKYSLPELLAELKLERASGVLAMEKLQQADIGSLFQRRHRNRRGKSEQ